MKNPATLILVFISATLAQPLASADDYCGDGSVPCDCPPDHAANCAQPYIYCDGKQVYNESRCPDDEEPHGDPAPKEDAKEGTVTVIVEISVSITAATETTLA